MDREEILEKSRRENRERDEMEREVRVRGESFSLMCTLLAGGVLVGWELYHNQAHRGRHGDVLGLLCGEPGVPHRPAERCLRYHYACNLSCFLRLLSGTMLS